MTELKLTILGCGSASPTPRHLPSCQVLSYRGKEFMIDCGEGAQLSYMKAGLSIGKLSNIFLSHLHGDHCLGLVPLLSTLSLHEHGGTITVHTFEDGAEIISRMMDFFCKGRSFNLKFNILDPKKPQLVYETGDLEVHSYPLLHRVPCVGYIFKEKQKPRHLRGDMVKFLNIPVSKLAGIKAGDDYTAPDGTLYTNERLTTDPTPSVSYAYCSDTVFNPEIIEYIKGVDVVYHEATYTDKDRQKAFERFHSTASQAAEIARLAGASKLIIGHYSKAYKDETEHLAEAQLIFPDTIAAREGMKIDIER